MSEDDTTRKWRGDGAKPVRIVLGRIEDMDDLMPDLSTVVRINRMRRAQKLQSAQVLRPPQWRKPRP